MGGWVYIAEGFGRGSSIGLVVWTAFQAVKFACTFIAGRLDARHDRLDAQEERLAKSLGSRLDHLEEAEETNQARIHLLEECVAILASEIRQQDPGNPKLREVAQILRGAVPIVSPDHAIDNLMARAANAVGKGSKQ